MGAAAVVVAVAALGAAQPAAASTAGPHVTATITPDRGDTYRFVDHGATTTVTAPATNVGSNLRVVAVAVGAPTSVDQESCTTWDGPLRHPNQPGVALRVRTTAGRTRAITVTNNIIYGARGGFNVHLADSGGAHLQSQMRFVGGAHLWAATVDAEGETAPVPWRLCARAVGTTVSFKAWAPGTHAEPAWGQEGHSAAVEVPADWVTAGRPGWYVGHLRPGEQSRFSGATTAVLVDEERWARDACFVDAAVGIFLHRPATEAERASWPARFAAGEPRATLPWELAGSEEWLGVEVDGLYQRALDRAPDPAGRAHWIAALRRGALVNEVARAIYGSDEAYQRAGATPEGFVTALYHRILGRAPDPGGLAHWQAQVDRLGRGPVAAAFFASTESRTDRVTGLYARILGRAPDSAGRAHWAERLRTVNDVRLAVELASSSELYQRAQHGCEPTGT